MKFLEQEIDKVAMFGVNQSETIKSLQMNAFDEFNKYGLPDKNWEDWKYSDFSFLNNSTFSFGLRKNISELPYPLSEFNSPNQIVFFNGYYQEDLSSIGNQLSINTIDETYNNNPELIEKIISTNKNPFHNINSAMMNTGLTINVHNDEIINEPIHIINFTSDIDEPIMNHPLFIMNIGDGSKVSIIEHYYGSTNIEYWVNTVTKIRLHKNSLLNHIRLQEDGNNSYHVADTEYILEKDAELKGFHYASGANSYRQNINVNLNDIGSSSSINGLCLSNHKQKHDHFITINHLKEKCTSNQLFKYILSDAALGIFNGKVIVKKDAQQTNANQTTRNLLLNDKAAAHSNPQLEIYADDVKCSHGSTTGQLDNNAIFYMRSRGIDFKSAQLLLINGFAKEILELISENKVNEYVNDQISYWLENININL
ncbi:MAG: Fe-S cluster assembly protein SufD [Candidatus Neomarinimicrobiota bacterium]|nr:Fe-S cluster assembly protein SufD [Candidatus Neomarinimicrobiota bacterium]